jgi:hypothetical protein
MHYIIVSILKVYLLENSAPVLFHQQSPTSLVFPILIYEYTNKNSNLWKNSKLFKGNSVYF